jgi:hypothetical protein
LREDRLENDGTYRVHNNNDVLVDRCDGFDEVIAVVPGIEVVSITRVALDRDVTLAAVGRNKNDGGVSAVDGRTHRPCVI